MSYEDHKGTITDDNEIYYIYVKNGKPVGNPYTKSNLKNIIKDFENNIPENIKRFYPSDYPLIDTPYKTVLGSSYEVYNDEVYHVYHLREMPRNERDLMVENYKKWWHEEFNYKGWYFDPWYCRYFPPIEEPKNGSAYYWNNETLNWELKDD